VSITLEQPPSVDLGEAAQALCLEQLHRPTQLCEVLLHYGIRQLGEDLRPELLDRDRSSLTSCTIRTYVRRVMPVSGPVCEIRHEAGNYPGLPL
jgi:hypothetical protein